MATAADLTAQLQKSGNERLYRISTLCETQLFIAFSLDVSDDGIASWQQALEQSYRDGTMRRLYQTVYSNDSINRLEAALLDTTPELRHLLFQRRTLPQSHSE